MNPTVWGLGLYVLITILIGYWVSRRIRSETDYLVAGRSFGYPLAIFSIFATWFGAETCVSSAAAVHDEGLAGSRVEPIGYAGCILFMGAVFAIPLWRRKLFTLVDLFQQRYSPRVGYLAVAMMLPGSLFWAAAQIRAFGQVLGAAANWDVDIAISVAAVVVVIYTTIGGLKADAITDLVQGCLLILGLGVLVSVVATQQGGFTASIQNVSTDRLAFRSPEEASWLATLEAWAIPICGSVIAQELIARVLAARTPQIARNGTLLGGALYLAVGMLPVYLGLVGNGLVENLTDSEQLVPLLAQKYLPTALYILFAGALVSAILSTVDSALLACGALLSHNWILPIAGTTSDRRRLLITRGTVVFCGLIAFVIALRAGRIYDLIETASSIGTSGLFVIMVMGLFTSFGGTASATAALITGLVSYLVGEYALADYPYSFTTSLAAALLAYVTFGFAGTTSAPTTPES